ncbi:MAG: RsmD family RNA methyltransferase [Fimbriiglobus sp.]
MQKTELRIVAGSLRGRKLMCHVHEGMRPTPQMVREALFSILGNAVPGRIFYDVFAGSGVNGLEAISRGASRAALIEKDAKQVNDIQKHVDAFAVRDRVQVLRADVYRWAERWVPPPGGPVNLFFSPPFPDLGPAHAVEFLGMLATGWKKAVDDSVLVVQAEDGFPLDDLPGGPDAWDIRKYGRNLLLFRVKGDDAAPLGPDESTEAE